KRQQQRRQQQNAGLKRKRDTSTATALPMPAHSANSELKTKGLDAYFHTSARQKPLQRAHSAVMAEAAARPSTILSASAALVQNHQHAASSSPFAAAPRVLRHNPFDIIKHEISLSQEGSGAVICLDDDNLEEGAEQRQVVVVGASGNLSDSEPEESTAAEHGAQRDEWSDFEGDFGENDPSLYKVLPYISSSQSLDVPASQTSNAAASRPASLGSAAARESLMKSPSMMQVDEEDDWHNGPEPDRSPVPLSSPCLNGLRLDSGEPSIHANESPPARLAVPTESQAPAA
ncbi:hypothetical protein GGF38_003875, partial [Coemansia sp. RSA 25]